MHWSAIERQGTASLLADEEALADLRQSREEFAAGDTFSLDEVRAELERWRGGIDDRAGRQLVAEWQAEHGAFAAGELAAARAEMAAADAAARRE
ncbi:hypothetical protein BJ973_008292 [Actinoplanes tereljensis]|uniref:Uncharacterized protein n=1 Tax=Paractinoplanes tereljensis TaxID=571912 RepID=A0A919NIC9_9ACTN|nr:hypothetical protein [Actinoplanes tereljensis]GIF18748.1 hypothetical protein Ate02nite_14780 [Actinoplanes tereljensis]